MKRVEKKPPGKRESLKVHKHEICEMLFLQKPNPYSIEEGRAASKSQH
jgi:hypothetical protein